MFREALKDYFINSSIHGFKFIAQKRRHWSERLFWIVCVILSWTGCLMLIRESYIAYENNPISFGVETTYLDWQTEFPSIVVCEAENEQRFVETIPKVFPQYYEEDSPFYEIRYDLEEGFKEIIFFKGTTYYIQINCFVRGVYNEEIGCPKTNFTAIVQKFRMNCTELFAKCAWNDVEFDCCTYFLELETEYGICYAVNNLNTKEHKYYPLVSNQSSGPGTLSLILRAEQSSVYVIPYEEVPHSSVAENDKIRVAKGLAGRFFIKVNDISNQPEVRDIEITRRNCRFADENYLEVYPVYSTSGCLVNCRKKLQLQKCNCTSYFMPSARPDQYCDIYGLLCLNSYDPSFRVRKTSWSSKQEGFYCSCEDSCETKSIAFVRWLQDLNTASKTGLGELELKLDHLPSERFRRTVVRGKLDLVVSMGGAAGLFLGASLLSFVELVYFLTIRLYVTVRYKKNCEKTPQPQQVTIPTAPAMAPWNVVSNNHNAVLVPKKVPVNLQHVFTATTPYYTMPTQKSYRHPLHRS